MPGRSDTEHQIKAFPKTVEENGPIHRSPSLHSLCCSKAKLWGGEDSLGTWPLLVGFSKVKSQYIQWAKRRIAFPGNFLWNFESFKRQDIWTSFGTFVLYGQLQADGHLLLHIDIPSNESTTPILTHTHHQCTPHSQGLARYVSSAFRNSVVLFLYMGKPSPPLLSLPSLQS